jgi:hypothetical protein
VPSPTPISGGFPSIYPAINCFTLPPPSLDSCLMFQIARLFRSCCRILQAFDGFWWVFPSCSKLQFMPEAPLATTITTHHLFSWVQRAPCYVDSCSSLKCCTGGVGTNNQNLGTIARRWKESHATYTPIALVFDPVIRLPIRARVFCPWNKVACF